MKPHNTSHDQSSINELNSKEYHKMSLSELSRVLGTSLTDGLDQANANQLLVKYGRNQIKQKKESTLLKLISYLFTGFCGLLWISAIICLLAWKPIGNYLIITT
jgi:sodium/potassium-transporting ATPase subunit alpha